LRSTKIYGFAQTDPEKSEQQGRIWSLT